MKEIAMKTLLISCPKVHAGPSQFFFFPKNLIYNLKKL